MHNAWVLTGHLSDVLKHCCVTVCNVSSSQIRFKLRCVHIDSFYLHVLKIPTRELPGRSNASGPQMKHSQHLFLGPLYDYSLYC